VCYIQCSICVLQEDDLKWVEDNIPATLSDKYVNMLLSSEVLN